MKEAKEGPCMSIGMKRGTVYLEEHQKIWEDNAKQTICEIQDLLVGIGADVEHVGSTSIKSIKAKPIIDIAVGVEEYEEILSRNEQLQKAGIVFRFDERPQQLLYVKGDFEADTRTHHIHVVKKGSKEWKGYLNFRDYLNAKTDAAKEYESVKERLAQLYPNDREAYVEGKAEVVTKLLKEAANWRNRSSKTIGECACLLGTDIGA